MSNGIYIPVAGTLGNCSKQDKSGPTDGSGNLMLMRFAELSARNAQIANSMNEED